MIECARRRRGRRVAAIDMREIRIPIVKGTPLKTIVESFIRAMVSEGVGSREVIESEVYWIMEERRQDRIITRKERHRANYEANL